MLHGSGSFPQHYEWRIGIMSTQAARVEYRIETRAGYYSAFEKIGGYTFPVKYNASFQGATVYDVRNRALAVISSLRKEGHYATLLETPNV
jgi:hypothetical protein